MEPSVFSAGGFWLPAFFCGTSLGGESERASVLTVGCFNLLKEGDGVENIRKLITWLGMN